MEGVFTESHKIFLEDKKAKAARKKQQKSQKLRADFLKEVGRKSAHDKFARHLTLEEFARKGEAAKSLSKLQQMMLDSGWYDKTKLGDEFAASIPADAGRGMFQSPTGSPTGGPTPVLVRALTPLKLGGKPVQAAGGKGGKGKKKPNVTTRSKAKKSSPIDLTWESGDDGGIGSGGGGGGKRPPDEEKGPPDGPPPAPRKKKRHKIPTPTPTPPPSDTDSDEFTDPSVPDDAAIPNPNSGAPGLMDDEKDTGDTDPQAGKSKSGFDHHMEFVKQLHMDERQLRELLANSKEIDKNLALSGMGKKDRTRAIGAIKDAIHEFAEDRRRHQGADQQQIDDLVSAFSFAELQQLLRNKRAFQELQSKTGFPENVSSRIRAAMRKELKAKKTKPKALKIPKAHFPKYMRKTRPKKPKGKIAKHAYTKQFLGDAKNLTNVVIKNLDHATAAKLFSQHSLFLGLTIPKSKSLRRKLKTQMTRQKKYVGEHAKYQADFGAHVAAVKKYKQAQPGFAKAFAKTQAAHEKKQTKWLEAARKPTVFSRQIAKARGKRYADQAIQIAQDRKQRQKAYHKQKASRRYTSVAGTAGVAKLQIKQEGPGAYSVRSTGVSPQVKKHIQHLLNRLSGKLYLDGKLMSKKAALTYIVKQLTDRKTVQVKIVQ